MENGRKYWVVEKYDDYADHPNDRGWKRYDDEVYYTTEAACQADVDKWNAPKESRQAQEVERARALWEQQKADWDALVEVGRREGPFADFKPPYHDKDNTFQVGTAIWNEKQEGDKITIEVY